jgi:hypothetical protein
MILERSERPAQSYDGVMTDVMDYCSTNRAF